MEAKAAFDTACASCHGLDARGGERGPDLVSRSEVVRKTDAELRKILTDGKTSAGMPSFASYAPAKLSALVDYLRSRVISHAERRCSLAKRNARSVI